MINALTVTAQALMEPSKGLLAMDESVGTCNRRLAECGIAQTEEFRRRYRELLVTAPGLSPFISGAILLDETLRQNTRDGVLLADVLRAAGILVGIKVDAGTTALADHPGERVTEGLDGLRERLARFATLGVCFAKWRAVLVIADGLPTQACIQVNAHALARYASLCQEAQIVPVVEPEVLMDGGHTLTRCAEVTTEVLHQVFEQLHEQGVALEAMILKPNMVLPGLSCGEPASLAEVAEATLSCLRRTVPAAVVGVAFLSGGQPATLATARLNAMHQPNQTSGSPAFELPWPLSFSFGRALQQPALGLWAGKDGNRVIAQNALLHRARCNAAAVQGAYSDAMDEEARAA
ncbi:class I fructose-bisphosphate aldolase [Hydrogenophaga sp.]|uniref:class I fructose-bisphosphate aldolase n=1 Tax=Hydrogenophaga sp. TaxID=1904254 RepID=UPI0025BE0235|nr:class I fructose-bisphosphate aldolase [Hydrogenophaga sp.]